MRGITCLQTDAFNIRFNKYKYNGKFMIISSYEIHTKQRVIILSDIPMHPNDTFILSRKLYHLYIKMFIIMHFTERRGREADL